MMESLARPSTKFFLLPSSDWKETEVRCRGCTAPSELAAGAIFTQPTALFLRRWHARLGSNVNSVKIITYMYILPTIPPELLHGQEAEASFQRATLRPRQPAVTLASCTRRGRAHTQSSDLQECLSFSLVNKQSRPKIKKNMNPTEIVLYGLLYGVWFKGHSQAA